jgi:hypothetical protein
LEATPLIVHAVKQDPINFDRSPRLNFHSPTKGWSHNSRGRDWYLCWGKEATTHWHRAKEILTKYGAEFQQKRWVRDGKYWTSAGVTAGIDMALVDHFIWQTIYPNRLYWVAHPKNQTRLSRN